MRDGEVEEIKVPVEEKNDSVVELITKYGIGIGLFIFLAYLCHRLFVTLIVPYLIVVLFNTVHYVFDISWCGKVQYIPILLMYVLVRYVFTRKLL